MISDFSSSEAAKANPDLVLKTDRDKLVDAEKRIAQLELERRNLSEALEKLKWQAAQLRVAVTALGEHFQLPVEDAKKIVDDYIQVQEKKYAEMAEKAKEEFVAKLKAGHVPDLRVVDGDLKG